MRCVLLNNSGPRGLPYETSITCLTNLQDLAGDGAGQLAEARLNEGDFYVIFIEGDELAAHFIRYVSGLVGTSVLAVHTATLGGEALDFDLLLKDPNLQSRVIHMMLARYKELAA